MDFEVLNNFYKNHNRIQRRVNTVLNLSVESERNIGRIIETWEGICNLTHFNFLSLQRVYETSSTIDPQMKEIYSNHLIVYGQMIQQDLEHLRSLKRKL